MELFQTAPLHRYADDARALAHHEGDVLGGCLLGGNDEIAFVLALLVVNDDNHATVRDLLDRLFDAS
jgi:hypothetical protein